MNRLLIKTSMSNWVLEFKSMLKLQKLITIINDSTLNDDDFISSINIVIDKFALRPWHNILRIILLYLLPLLALLFIFAFVQIVILEIGAGFSFIKIASSTSSILFGIAAAIFGTVKLYYAKRPISNINGKSITIIWEKY